MTLRSPGKTGLRVFHNSNSAQRVELVIGAGDDLNVSPKVAQQLARASTHFEVDQAELDAALAAERAAEAAESEQATSAGEAGAPATAAESLPDAGARRTGTKPKKATAKSTASTED